jgi:hypothetical protein
MASMAFATGDQLQTAPAAKAVVPLRIGQVGPDNSIIRWVDYGNRQQCNWLLTFDCYEPDVDDCDGDGDDFETIGFATCGVDPVNEDCDPSTTASLRWYYGRDYCNMYVCNDMQFDPAYAGKYVERHNFAWQWWVNGPQSQENMALLLQTYEDFDDSCVEGDPNHAGQFLGGVIAYFGMYNGSDGGYYYTDIDYCGYEWMQLPTDGAGSYKIWLLTYTDPNDPNTLALATCGQQMLWGTGFDEFLVQDCVNRGMGPCPDGNSSDQGPIQWDDDAVIDGFHSVVDEECYDYTAGLCPDPLGAMIAMWIDDTGEDCPGDINGDGITHQADLGIVLGCWGCTDQDPCWNEGDPPCSAADLDNSGHVHQGDLGVVLGDWGCGM